jgi:hypothetical protein
VPAACEKSSSTLHYNKEQINDRSSDTGRTPVSISIGVKETALDDSPAVRVFGSLGIVLKIEY